MQQETLTEISYAEHCILRVIHSSLFHSIWVQLIATRSLSESKQMFAYEAVEVRLSLLLSFTENLI